MQKKKKEKKEGPHHQAINPKNYHLRSITFPHISEEEFFKNNKNNSLFRCQSDVRGEMRTFSPG